MKKLKETVGLLVFLCILYASLCPFARANTADGDLQDFKLLIRRQGEALQKLEQQQKDKDGLIDQLRADIVELREHQKENDIIILQQRADIETLKTQQARKDEIIKTLAGDVEQLKRRQHDGGHTQDTSTEVKSFEDSQENVRQQIQRSDDTSPLEVVVSQLSQTMTDFRAQLQSLNNAVTQITGSVYIRWGSRTCPSTSHMVYTGVIAGSSFHHSGSATNSLCLPLEPTYTTGAHLNVDYGYAAIFGTEYEVHPEAANNRKSVCSVCMSGKSHTVMVPVTKVCPTGWTKEYEGYIMANQSPGAGNSVTEYLCVDSSLEGLLGSEATNNDEHLLYYAKTYCGSLPCPPFVNGQVANCVVCSL